MQTGRIAVFTSISMFIFYFSNDLVYWLYSFKQWTISVQVPQMIKSRKEQEKHWLTQKRYQQIKWAGVAVIFVIVTIYAVLREILWRDFKYKD